jgi:Prephenate dehydrogenase
MTVGIIGLGLIGGSMAKSIKTRTAHTVYGIDSNHETMMLSRLCGAIDGTLDNTTLADCELILLAVRPGAAISWVIEHAESIPKSATVCDLCGVKRAVCAAITPIAKEYGFGYIGGHPMAGREVSGFVNSRADLYEGAAMILTPDARTSPRLLETLKNFFTDIGFATLTFTTPEEHDRIIALTSQLAHIVSNAYVKSPEAQKRRGFSAGSFKDMTRVARLDEDMWTELFLSNSDYLTEQLEFLVGSLTEYLDALKHSDADKLRDLLRDGRLKKASAGGD